MKLLIPPPLQGLICAGLIWVCATYFPQYSIDVPYKKILSAIFFVIGIMTDLMALRVFHKAQTTVSPFSPENTTSLIAVGVYQYSRNPMYLGMALLLTGLTIWFGTPFGLALIVCFVWSITVFQIKPEEEVLREKFGDDYVSYCHKVRRWV